MDEPQMTVAVAGATGFVGSAIVRAVAKRGHKVVALKHRRTPRLPESVEYRAVDVTKPETVAGVLEDVDCLAIALAFNNFPVEAPRRGQTFAKIDAAGTELLVSVARASGVKRIVYISGAGAAPDAGKSWFKAKWRAEEAVRNSGIDYTILRPSWIYGRRDKSLNRFLNLTGWLPFVPQIGNGKQKLAPVFVEDIGELVADAIESSGAANKTLEVGGPEVLEMDEIIRAGLHALGRNRRIIHAPVTLMKIVTAPLVLLPSPPLSPSAIDFVVQSAQVDSGPLHEVLPRRLRPLSETLPTYLGKSRPAAETRS